MTVWKTKSRDGGELIKGATKDTTTGCAASAPTFATPPSSLNERVKRKVPWRPYANCKNNVPVKQEMATKGLTTKDRE